MQDEQELVPTCPPPMSSPSAKVPIEAVTMDGIAALLQQQLGPITASINALNAGVEMLDAKSGERSAAENRLKDMEARMDATQTQVAKMHELMQHLYKRNKKLKA